MLLLSLRLKRRSSGGTLVGATLTATLTVVLAALMLAVFPAVAEAQDEAHTEAQTEDKSTPSVVVQPGDSLWSISEERLAPNATPQRILNGTERIYALNRNLIGADPDLIFVGQELVVPPVMSPGRSTGTKPARGSAGKITGAAEAAQEEAGPRDQTAKDTTGSEATAKATKTAAGGADAKGGNVSAPVAESQADRGTERQAERQAEPVSLPVLPDEAAEPVPAVEAVASSRTQAEGLRLLGLVGIPLLTLVVAALVAWKLFMRRTTLQGLTGALTSVSNKLRPHLHYLGMAALVFLGLPVVVLVLTLLAPNEGPVPVGAPDAADAYLQSDHRLLGLGVLLLTLVVAALMAWKLAIRRTTREDTERWGIPTRYYYGAHGVPAAAHRNATFAPRPGSPEDRDREGAREEASEPLAPEQRGVPSGNGHTPAANGVVRDASATASAIASDAAARRVRKAKAKAKAKPRNGLALGAHNPRVRSASLLARAPARAPARATARATARVRKPRPLRRAARPPLVSAQATMYEESKPKPLGAVGIEGHYPVVALALKQILKGVADVYDEGHHKRHPEAEEPSCIVLCPNGKDLASEVRRLKASNPEAAVLLFDLRDEPRLVHKALRAGASGFLHAGMRPEQIVRALRLAPEGNEAVVSEGLFGDPLPEGQEPAMADLTVLTPRQRQIVGLVCEGLSNAQIAKRLSLTESTVKQHLRAAYKLLKVRNRVQAAKLLLREA